MEQYKLINKKEYPKWSTEGKTIFNESDIITGTCNVAYFVSKNPEDWERINNGKLTEKQKNAWLKVKIRNFENMIVKRSSIENKNKLWDIYSELLDKIYD